MSFLLKFLGVVLTILVLNTSCERASLKDMISLNLMQIHAKSNGEYCYATNQQEVFCLVYKSNLSSPKGK